jgi:hypothetical protein
MAIRRAVVFASTNLSDCCGKTTAGTARSPRPGSYRETTRAARNECGPDNGVRGRDASHTGIRHNCDVDRRTTPESRSPPTSVLYKAIIASAAAHANTMATALWDAENPKALRRLVASGVQLRPFSAQLMDTFLKTSNEVNAEAASSNADFKKMYDRWSQRGGRSTQLFRTKAPSPGLYRRMSVRSQPRRRA